MTRLLAITILVLCMLPALSGAIHESCRFDDVSFSSAFEGARLTECRKLGDAAFELLIEPESVPINDSPWYAFRVTVPESAPLRPLSLRLRYGDGTHRYRPKMLLTGAEGERRWQAIPRERLDTGEEGWWSTFELSPPSRTVTISAQPLLTNADHQAFLRTFADRQFATLEILGRSVEGRPIEALRIEAAGPTRPWVVLLGRQHPPEVPGSLALQAFLGTLLDDSERAAVFRSTFNVLAVPNLNPDGVARGHWRLNANHVDLNRDWGPFTQPETRAAGAMLQDIGAPNADGGLWLLLDFHSTRRDVFYTQLDPPEIDLPDLTSCWLTRVDNALPDYDVARAPRHLIDGTTAKSWATRVLNAPAVTYEVGDATEIGIIDHVARTAAEKMMQTLLGVQDSSGTPCAPGCGSCEAGSSE